MRLRGRVGWTIVLFCLVGLVTAQDAPQDSPTKGAAKKKISGLGVRQARVERMMEDVDRKFTELSQKLQETEPERAKRLIETLQQAKQLLIQKRMGEITAKLNDKDLETATDEQKDILVDIRDLIQLLLDEQDKDVLDEIKRLEKWRQKLQDIIKEEKRLQREAEKVANKDETLGDLDSQIAAVKKLIRKQTDVNKEMSEARKKGVQAYQPVADSQHDVRKETEETAEAIGRAGGQGKEDSKAVGVEDPKGEGSKEPKESKESQGKESKGSQGKESKGSQGKESKGSEGSKESKSGSEGSKESQGSQSPSDSESKPQEPGQQPLEKAAGNQQKAEQNLQKGKGKSAEKDGETALDDLKKALSELEKEKRRIASLPPEAFDEMAKKQDKAADKTASLEEDMKKAGEKSDGDSKSGSSSSKSGGKQPGQKQIQQAQKNMKQASGDLRLQDPEGAARQQKEATRQLKKALEEIEERLAQLREETQEEKLARLEARFVEMLARQEVASKETKVLNEKKESGGRLRRADRLAMAQLAVEEQELAEMAQQAFDILIEDGTSVVFPSIVEGLRDDLLRVGEMIEEQQTGEYTQYLQSEVETTLNELIDALRKRQKESKSGGGGGGGNCEPPLLPNSAELKLLRAAQMRVNRRTKAFDENRDGATLADLMKKEVKDISLRQLDIALMTEQIIERSQNVPLGPPKEKE